MLCFRSSGPRERCTKLEDGGNNTIGSEFPLHLCNSDIAILGDPCALFFRTNQVRTVTCLIVDRWTKMYLHMITQDSVRLTCMHVLTEGHGGYGVDYVLSTRLIYLCTPDMLQ